jgi:hypothetical protein
MVAIVLGLILLAVSWMCWSGRWRAWSRIAMLPSAPITLVPAVGIILIAAGAGGLAGPPVSGVLYALALAAGLAGTVLWMWDPNWYGPAWYRSRDTTYDVTVPLNAAIAASVRTEVARSSEAEARAAAGPGEPLERWRAHLVSDAYGQPSAMQRVGVVRGHLLLWEDALAFAADAREDRMRGEPVTVVIPARSIRAVARVPAGSRPEGARSGPDLPSRVMPRLRVETEEGTWYFEAARAGRRAAELAQRYVRAVAR